MSIKSIGTGVGFVSRAAFMALMLSVAVTSAAGQTVGATMTGRVTDPSGAVIPGATVTITNTGTSAARSVLTGESGLFRSVNLQPGSYDIAVDLPGFSTAMRKGVTLNVGAELTLDFQLSLSAVTQTVDVQAIATVDLVSATVNRTVEGTTIRE